MRTFLRPLVAALVAALLAGCAGAGSGDRAATVNGEVISRDLLERVVNAELEAAIEPAEGDELDAQTDEIQRAILSALINFRIVADLAEEQGVEPSEAELEEALEEEIELSGGEEAFEEFLPQIGLTREEYRDLIVANNVRRERLMESVAGDVSDEELREAYDLQRDSRYVTRTTRHILVETEDEADEALEELADGDDFADVAAERSMDPGSAEQGGDLGAQPRGQFVPPFDDAVWESDIGDVVGPVETDFGFHVIEILDEDVQEFEDVRDELRQELQAGQTETLVDGLIRDAIAAADVDVAPGLGTWDPDLGQVVGPERVGETPEPEPDLGEPIPGLDEEEPAVP